MRPIPVSNQKLKDWNNFLVDFNKAAEAELPKKPDGTPNWELLDKNEAFGNYKGGQDFYKKKFAEYVTNKGVTGADRLTEADFPIIQKLYADMYTAAKADPQYYDAYIKPRLTRLGVDLNTFDPSATVTGKGNTEGWVGSVTRNFFFDQDDRTGKGGSNPQTANYLKTFFPASFNQGESFYENNPTGPGVRYHDKGGKLMCYNEGGRMEMDVEVEDGGDLEEISEDHVVVNADNPDAKDSVTLTTKDKVGDKEVINTETKVVFGNLPDPVTGNLFKDDAMVRAKEMAQLENHPMPWAKRRLDVLKKQDAEAYDRQQKLNGNNGGENHQDGGNLTAKVDVDPPKKKLFYVPEDDTMYQVSEDKVTKYADKLKNATEYTDVKPEGYSSDKVYLEKNGVLKEFTRENAKIILKQPEAAGSREVYPVSTGQKKNTDIQKKGNQTTSNNWDNVALNLPANNEVTYSYSKEAEITGPLPNEMTSQSVQNLQERNKKVEQYAKEFEDGYNSIIEPTISKNRAETISNLTDPIGLFKQKHPEIENEEEIIEGARQARNNDNTLVANTIIPELRKKEEQFINYSKLNEDEIFGYNIQDSESFRNYLDNLKDGYKGIKLKREDGTYLDTDNITESQWQEIRNQVINTYQVKTIWDKKAKEVQEATKIAISSDDPKNPLANFIKAQGVDKGIIPLSDEQWKPYFETMEKIGEKYAPIMTNLGVTIEKDNAAFKLGYQNEVNEFSQVIEPKVLEFRKDLQQKIQEGLPEQDAQKLWDDFQTGIQKEETIIFEKWNKLQNENSQKKLKIVEDSINIEVKEALKNTVFEKIDLSKVDKKYVTDSINAFYDLTSSFTNNELARGERFLKDYHIKIYNGNDYAQQFGVEMRRGVLQMIESTGGFVSFMGGYEVGNTVNDFSAQFNQNNPQYEMGHFEFSKLGNPDYWVALTGPMAGQQLVFLPLSITGAGLGTQVATKIGLNSLGTATLRGIGGAIAVRPFNAMVNSGSYYNELLANGVPIEIAAEKTADDFTYQLSIGTVDFIQIAAGFSPLGNIFKIGKVGALGTKVVGGVVTESIEEGMEGYHLSDYNSFQTVFDYATSPAGVDNLSGGAMGGLVMGGITAVPDLAAQRTGNTKKFLENLIYDMLSGSEMGKRYEDLRFTIEGLKERNILDDAEYQEAVRTLDFAYSKGREIPVDLSPPQRHQILTNLSDINRIEQLKLQTTDETLLEVYDSQIKEIKKKVGSVVAGKEPIYFIGNTPYSKEDFTALIENDEVLANLTLQKTSIEAFNDPKMSEAIEVRKEEFLKQLNPVQDDSKNIEGVQSDLRVGEESIQTELNQGASTEETSPSGMVSEEQIVESNLTPEQEQAEETRHAEEEKVIEEYYNSHKEPMPTAEEIDELNSLFYIEDGKMFDVDGNPTNINDVVKKYNELKEGTVFESNDGKIRYIREEGEIIRRDAKGNRVEAQRYVLKGGKKTKVEAPKGTTFMDAKTIKKYDQERLDAGLEEGEIAETSEAEKIAETSNNPKQIKEAWEDEKVRLRDEVDTENIIYEAVKENGIQAKDYNQMGDRNKVKDGSVSAVGWFSSKALPIDTIAQQAGVEVQDIIDFIEKYGKGAHEYKSQRETTLKALEARYKKLTGVNIKSVPRETKKEAKPKKEEPRVSVAQTNTQKAKELADKIRSFKSKPKTIKLTDENGNEIEGIIHTKSFWDELLEVAALAVEASGKLADGIKAALVHARKQDWYKKLTPEGQVAVDDQIKEMLEGDIEEVPKKERGHSKTVRKVDVAEKKEVKALLDKDPQFYHQISNQESIEKAQAFIDEYGIEEATDLALDKNVSVQDGLMANTLGLVLMDYYGQQAQKLEGNEKTKILNKIVQLSEAVGERMTLSGQQGQVMAIWTKMTPEAALLSVNKAIKRYNDSPQGEKRKKKFQRALAGYKTEQENTAKKVTQSERVKKIKGERVYSDIEKEINEQRKKEHAAIDKFVDKYFSTNTGGMTFAAIIPPAVAKGFVKTFVTAIKAGVEIKAAIKKAIAYLRIQMGDADVDYDKAEKFLEKFHGEMSESIKQPISDVESAVKQALRERNKKIDAIITSHLTERAQTKQELIDDLVKKTGVSEEAAKQLAAAVEEEFNKMTQGGAHKLIEKYFKGKVEKGKLTEAQKEAKKDKNSTINKINETLNLNGLVDEKLLTEYFGERFGVKSLSPQATENILKYSEAVQKTEGKFKERATQQLVQEISKMYGPSAMDVYWALWYPSMLSGLSTSTINVTNNAANVISKYFENPLNPSLWLKSIKDAIKNKDPKVFLYGNPLTETLMKPVYFFRGLGQTSRYTYNEMLDIMQKGMLDDKFADRQFQGGQKVEMSVLEDKRIQQIPILKYLEFYKYVGRFLQAQDAFFFRNNEESEFISSVYRQFTEKGLTGKELYQAVYDEVVGGADKADATLRMEKEAETYETITGNKLSKAQKTLRLIEILREGRNKEAQEEAKESAETMVYRGDYRGGIGTIAYMLSTVTQSKNPVGSGVRLFVPFTKIVSNVFNYMIDYTPVYGLLRANGLGITGLSERLRGPLKFMHKEIKSSQMGDKGSKAYYDQMGRAWIGLTTFSTLAAIIASQLDKDDDDETKIFIVGNHAGLNYEQSRNMEVTDPKGTIRIGKHGTPIPYRTIPALDVPLTILGNWMDLYRWKEGKGANEKIGLAILSSKNTFLEKSFVKGVNDLVTTVFDKKDNLQKTLSDLAKQGLGYATKPLPQNSTLVTQIDDIFSKYEYKPESMEDILKYSAYNGWNLDKPKLDVFGHPIKTYPGEQILPIQHWFALQDEDPVWKKLADEGLTSKISKFGDLHLYDEEGNALPTTDDQQYIYKAYAGREWYKLLNEYLNDEDLMTEKLSEHDFKGVDPENLDKKAKEKIIELAKEEAAKIAYYRIAAEYGQKYDLKDLDWMKYVPELTLEEVEE